MNIELIMRMQDACYLAKRAREMLPPLSNGVIPSYIEQFKAKAPHKSNTPKRHPSCLVGIMRCYFI